MSKIQIKIPGTITVGELAEQLDMNSTELITELFKNGVAATVNERIDAQTAEIILADIDKEYEIIEETTQAEVVEKRIPGKDSEPRPPVVAVMGHVDHGKTSLLDAIKGSEVTAGEAGGITQHISAYKVGHKGRFITFMDTPGHEAFSALRKHGAKLTDLAIIVVAADDGVKPQTKEAIKFAKQAGVKIMVAINKIDKETANVSKVLQELSDNGLMPETWGGDVVVQEVSATKNQGIEELMDMIFLVSDVEDLRADSVGPAEGLVIEAHTATGKGVVVSLLVEHGIIRKGDSVVAGTSYGKVKTLTDENGKTISEAGPSVPVIVTGFKQVPNFGDSFRVAKNDKDAKQIAKENSPDGITSGRLNMTGTELLKKINELKDTIELPVIVRADVKGSLQSVTDSLKGLENDEVSVRVVGSGVGSISESDITMAATSGSVIYGFSVDLPVQVKQLASNENVDIRIFDVIYELIDDVKERLEAQLTPEVIETQVAKLLVKGVFRTTKSEIICGGEVTKGKITPGLIARISRDGELIIEAIVGSVKRQHQDVKEVTEGDMCGLQLETSSKVLVEEGDKIEFVKRESKARKL